MRIVVGAAALAMSGLTLSAMFIGCGGSDSSTSSTGGGEGGSGASTGQGAGVTSGGGTAGAGGQACTPTTEVCDGVDNDCDGDVDEPPCTCENGATQECYSGRPDTKGIGECKAGTQTCDAKGVWGACTGEVKPAPEECNTKDDDCNGMVDDMGMTTCGVGACQVTVDLCTNGQTNVCTPKIPELEICDGLDNDCDQQADETFPDLGMVCQTGMPGVCSPGTKQCVNGAETCVADLTTANETCDGLDNDCDGTVDNDIPGTGGDCTTGQLGECSLGSISCQNSTIDCFPLSPSVPELCDGLDNDCDGNVDNGDPESGAACPTGQPGACAAGTEHCVMGALKCVANNSGQVEVCNSLDDDCNGSADDGDPGGGFACGCSGTSACVNGVIVCQGGPLTYFSEDFANDMKGWTLDTTWAIGPAVSSASSFCGNGDPGNDHSASPDNGVAGVVIGGDAPVVQHGYYYLTSPVINTAAASTLFFQFYRWLNSDYTPFMQNSVEVYNGTSWVAVFTTGGVPTQDATWTKQSFNIAAYKNANMRVRFGFQIQQPAGAFSCSQWNVDDVTVTATACP